MNAQHQATTGEWYTPPEWVELVREALGAILLDPCASAGSQRIVQAVTAMDRDDDGLSYSWREFGDKAFINPPGTCEVIITGDTKHYLGCGNRGPRARCSCKLPMRFLQKALAEAVDGVKSVYLAYSVNQLRQIPRLYSHTTPSTRPGGVPPVSITIAQPPDRIAYIDPQTMQPKAGTNCDSAFIHIALADEYETRNRFIDLFKGAGCAVYVRV